MEVIKFKVSPLNKQEKRYAKVSGKPITNPHPLVYLVWDCDECNRPESRRLALAATRSKNVKEAVLAGIVDGSYGYVYGSQGMTVDEQAERFEADWDANVPRQRMNKYLVNCCLDTTIAGKPYISPEERAFD